MLAIHLAAVISILGRFVARGIALASAYLRATWHADPRHPLLEEVANIARRIDSTAAAAPRSGVAADACAYAAETVCAALARAAESLDARPELDARRIWREAVRRAQAARRTAREAEASVQARIEAARRALLVAAWKALCERARPVGGLRRWLAPDWLAVVRPIVEATVGRDTAQTAPAWRVAAVLQPLDRLAPGLQDALALRERRRQRREYYERRACADRFSDAALVPNRWRERYLAGQRELRDWLAQHLAGAGVAAEVARRVAEHIAALPHAERTALAGIPPLNQARYAPAPSASVIATVMAHWLAFGPADEAELRQRVQADIARRRWNGRRLPRQRRPIGAAPEPRERAPVDTSITLRRIEPYHAGARRYPAPSMCRIGVEVELCTLTQQSGYMLAPANPAWRVERDSSIRPCNGEVGAEVIAPPLRLPDLVAVLRAWHAELVRQGARPRAGAKRNCGLHVSLASHDPSRFGELFRRIWACDRERFLAATGRTSETVSWTNPESLRTHEKYQAVRWRIAPNGRRPGLVEVRIWQGAMQRIEDCIARIVATVAFRDLAAVLGDDYQIDPDTGLPAVIPESIIARHGDALSWWLARWRGNDGSEEARALLSRF